MSEPATGAPSDRIHEQVRARYAAIATTVISDPQVDAVCCDTRCDCAGSGAGAESGFGAGLYDAGDRVGLPESALLASLGCGNPLAVAELRAGETVLDLGSGGGIDVLLSARRVGPSGRALGLDMTEEMLALARRNAEDAAASNVEFIKGAIEAIPLADASVDVVISNCVINLSPDKPTVLAEMFRVLKPGGRIGISDVVAEDRLSSADRHARGSYVGCLAGALSVSEYRQGLAATGFSDIDLRLTHPVADGMHGAIIRAIRPGAEALVASVAETSVTYPPFGAAAT